MENTSKALLIAAGVLVAIIIITIGIKVYTETSGVDKTASDVGGEISNKTDIAADSAISEVTNSSIPKNLKVGDMVYYDHTRDNNGNAVRNKTYKVIVTTYNINDYNKGWKVLSVNNEKIQLISTEPVCSKYCYGYDMPFYENGISKLNEVSQMYAQGKGAESGRSLNVDDINRITGFNPNTFSGYNLEYTFYWDGTDKPYYECSNGTTGNLSRSHNSFYHFKNENSEPVCLSKSKTASLENKEKIISLKNNGYVYTLNSNNSIFSHPATLASRCVWIYNSSNIEYGLFELYGNRIMPTGNTRSNDRAISSLLNIRPVITLSSNVKLKGSSEQGWTIQ